jgi:hypothetical protein
MRESGFKTKLLVFRRNTEYFWNLGNLSKAMWGSVDALHPSWGKRDEELEKYRRWYAFKTTTNLWVDWPTLNEMLSLDHPEVEHKIEWWTGAF